jgi:CheY-like chemotaxis protein
MTKCKTVLVVEDKPSLAQMLRFLFIAKGMDVHAAFNGEDALSRLAAVNPDLILLDLMMPKMDGFETLRRLKGDPRWAPVPVIILTARKEREDMDRARALGAVEYITKPFKAVEVVDKVMRHLNA